MKQGAWVVTYNLSETLFTGSVRIFFLHEPTMEEVLLELLDGKPESEAPPKAVERVRAGDYKVDKSHVITKVKVFAGEDHYPSGGYKDYLKSFDSIEEARTFIKTLSTRNFEQRFEWAQIVVGDTIVEQWGVPFLSKKWVKEEQNASGL